jgi:hypothetical protein
MVSALDVIKRHFPDLVSRIEDQESCYLEERNSYEATLDEGSSEELNKYRQNMEFTLLDILYSTEIVRLTRKGPLHLYLVHPSGIYEHDSEIFNSDKEPGIFMDFRKFKKTLDRNESNYLVMSPSRLFSHTDILEYAAEKIAHSGHADFTGYARSLAARLLA